MSFSPRDPATWAASKPVPSLPEVSSPIAPDAIIERTRKALADEALPLEAARLLTADAIAAFQETAKEEGKAHERVTDLSSTAKQAEEAAAARGKLQTTMERLDSAIGRLLSDVIPAAEDRDQQASRRDLHARASERVKAAAKTMRQAEAAFVRAKEECQQALADARQANKTLPRGAYTIKIPDELKGEVILTVEQVERWCQQDGQGKVTPFEDKGIDTQGNKSIGVHPMHGFVRRGVFDKITFRSLGDEKNSVRLVHRPDLKTQVAQEEEPEDAKLATNNREAVLEALQQGTMTFIEHGKKTAARN